MYARRAHWIALSGAPALVACSLLLGEGYTDPDPGATNDSGTAGDDASADGSESDVRGESDASRDGSSDGSDGSGGPCGADYTFCDDFERDTLMPGPWTSATSEGLTGGIDDASSSSPTRSFFVNLPANTSGSYLLRLSAQDAGAPKRLRVIASMQLVSTMSYSTVLALAFGNVSQFIFVNAGAGMHLGEQDLGVTPTIYEATNAGGTPTGWHRYELDADLVARTATLYRDGAQVAKRDLVLTYKTFGSVRVGVG